MKELSALSGFDWLLIAVLAWSTFAGLQRGLVRVLFSLVGWTFGIVLASWNYVAFAPRLLPLCKRLPLAQAVAFALILAAAVMVAGLLGGVVHKAVKAVGLGFFNRIGGLALGAARGCLIGVSLLMAIAAFMPGSKPFAKSLLTPYFLAGAHAVSFVVPDNFQMQVSHGMTQLSHAVPGSIKSR